MNEHYTTTHGDVVTIHARLGLRGRRWYWTCTAANGEPLEWGEAYQRRIDCVMAAERHHPRVGEFE